MWDTDKKTLGNLGLQTKKLLWGHGFDPWLGKFGMLCGTARKKKIYLNKSVERISTLEVLLLQVFCTNM